jgi:hypothetical protein
MVRKGLLVFFLISTHSWLFSIEPKMSWLSGELLETGHTQGRFFLSLRNDTSGKIQHVICDRDTIQEIESQRKKGTHIHLKAKNYALGSPLLECMNKPMLRGGSAQAQDSKNHFSKENTNSPSQSIPMNGRRIIGQILEADPSSGLLTIQTALRKTYLKVSPEAAEAIHGKLSQMEMQNIDDTFIYDRNRGYFVGTTSSFR